MACLLLCGVVLRVLLGCLLADVNSLLQMMSETNMFKLWRTEEGEDEN